MGEHTVWNSSKQFSLFLVEDRCVFRRDMLDEIEVGLEERRRIAEKSSLRVSHLCMNNVV